LHNLESLPGDDFTMCCFPAKIRGTSAGWTRAVAIFNSCHRYLGRSVRREIDLRGQWGTARSGSHAGSAHQVSQHFGDLSPASRELDRRDP
jgi:hypothetical protein